MDRAVMEGTSGLKNEGQNSSGHGQAKVHTMAGALNGAAFVSTSSISLKWPPQLFKTASCPSGSCSEGAVSGTQEEERGEKNLPGPSKITDHLSPVRTRDEATVFSIEMSSTLLLIVWGTKNNDSNPNTPVTISIESLLEYFSLEKDHGG